MIVLSLIVFLTVGSTSCGEDKPSSAADPVYTEVDEMPVFTGGDMEILNYVAKNTVYPAEAKQKNITGKVIVKFIVETDGTVSNCEILKSVDPILDEEALRVVKTLPKFEKAALKDGKPARVYFMLPITFQLQ